MVGFLWTAAARLAQSAERKALNLVVVGSSPTVGVFETCLQCAGVPGGRGTQEALTTYRAERARFLWSTEARRRRVGLLGNTSRLFSSSGGPCNTLDFLAPRELTGGHAPAVIVTR